MTDLLGLFDDKLFDLLVYNFEIWSIRRRKFFQNLQSWERVMLEHAEDFS